MPHEVGIRFLLGIFQVARGHADICSAAADGLDAYAGPATADLEIDVRVFGHEGLGGELGNRKDGRRTGYQESFSVSGSSVFPRTAGTEDGGNQDDRECDDEHSLIADRKFPCHA